MSVSWQWRSVRLGQAAARAGDKGDALNIGVIARYPEYLPWIRRGLGLHAGEAFFAHEFKGAKAPKVVSYEPPGLGPSIFTVSRHWVGAVLKPAVGPVGEGGGPATAQVLDTGFLQAPCDRGADAPYREQDGPLVCWKGHAGLAQL